MKFIFPTILLLLSITSFAMFTNPTYQEAKELKNQVGQRDDANSRKLQEERDALGVKYRSIPTDAIDRLGKMLPDNADNIRLIIDIQRMAQTYGMSLGSIQFDATQTAQASKSALAAGTPTVVAGALKNYGVFNLAFTTTANYDDFQKFLKDLESSLRLTDIDSVDFTTDAPAGGGKTGYTYTVKLRTYWLRT